MNDFKKLFPSLKDFDIDCRDLNLSIHEQEIVEEVILRLSRKMTKEVEEACLDKQRVKKSFKLLKTMIFNHEEQLGNVALIYEFIEDIEKEELKI